MANDPSLRVSFSRKAHANLVAHAKESVDAEVCGVLVGEVREERGVTSVDVKAIIRGAAAREARAHVTFTHETWNHIHATLDKEYPDLEIVGWYHTHPGFGVEFSAMDTFIHENFFSGPAQVAYLSDPLSGDVSICTNAAGGLHYQPKFWVDGREHAARSVPVAGAVENVSSHDGDLRRDLERLEQRVGQLVNALDEQSRYFHRTLLTMLVVFCAGIVTWLGWRIWSDRLDRIEPPRVQSYVPVPVKVGDKTVFLGVALTQWEVPRELDALLDKIAKREVEERIRMQKELEEQQRERRQKGKKP